MDKEITFKNILSSAKELARKNIGEKEAEMHLRIIEESVKELNKEYRDNETVIPLRIELDAESKKFLKSIELIGKDL
jgi:ssRNA-specific RNase YbeY (16S rRNA maturation enzyme)